MQMANPEKFEKSNGFQFIDVKVFSKGGVELKKTTPCCATCGQKATLFISQVDAVGNVMSKSFCIAHALKTGAFHPKSWDLLGIIAPAAPAKPEVTCRCGMNESLLQLKGRTGCAHCYTTFAKILKQLLPKIHNACVHAGKSPRKAAPRINVRARVEFLEQALHSAVKQEAYEQAAILRDQIASLSAGK